VIDGLKNSISKVKKKFLIIVSKKMNFFICCLARIILSEEVSARLGGRNEKNTDFRR
jgi:hypothetical protein